MAEPPVSSSPQAGSAPPSSGPPYALRVIITVAAVLFCLSPYSSPAIALFLGVALALAGLVVAGDATKKISRYLIQFCVVLLGFRMNLGQIAAAGGTGLLFAAGTILATFALGYVMGLWLRTDQKITTLISAGTAICGGSAVAAVGSVLAASSTQMSVAIGTVFVLNGIALYIFPPLGHWLELSPTQFGTWAAVAIHDVSSVVGAAASFDDRSTDPVKALDIATAVKLARVLWIVPVCIVVAAVVRKSTPKSAGKPATPIPWFVLLFILASVCRTYIPSLAEYQPTIELIAKKGMTLALFLVGAGLSRKALASVGWRPMLLGIILWIFIALVSLAVVRTTMS